MKELHVAPESNPKAVVAIMDDDEAGRFLAQVTAASLTKENGERYVVVVADDTEEGD